MFFYQRSIRSYEVIWEREYEFEESVDCKYLLQTSPNEYLLQIWSENKSWFVKTDSLGFITSKKETERKFYRKIKNSLDGGLVLASDNRGNVRLIKNDAEGNEEWQKEYSIADYCIVVDVFQGADGGYILIGDGFSYFYE